MSRATDIDAVLTEAPLPAKAIWQKIDCWSLPGVKQELDKMAAAGSAVRTEDTNLPGYVHKRYLYARPAA